MAGQWAELCTAESMTAAEIIKGALESAGITVRLNWESLGMVYFGPSGLGPLSEVRVYVPVECEAEARAYLAEVEKTDK